MCLMTHTTELSLEEDLEVVSASQVTQQLKKAEGPALHSTLSGNLNSGHKHKNPHFIYTIRMHTLVLNGKDEINSPKICFAFFVKSHTFSLLENQQIVRHNFIQRPYIIFMFSQETFLYTLGMGRRL